MAREVHRGYHLFCLLSGCRPGEGSRIKLNDIDTDARMFVIRNAKAGKDIHLPITPEIAFAISLAVNVDLIRHFLMGHAPKGISQDYVALLILQNGPAMREAQEQISKRLFSLLGLSAKTFQHEFAAAPVASLELSQAGATDLAQPQRSLARTRRGKGNARSPPARLEPEGRDSADRGGSHAD
jgi:integrase